MSAASFPLAEVVGQDDAKLALILTTVDPRIGGVLLRGHKGTAKTTLARGLADLLGEAPFVELPLGVTEDRLMGSLDSRTALSGGGFHFRPGLLAEAHGGVLYVDEINLLADHLVDSLLDVCASGENIVERDGISHRHPAEFVLVGSMNPEEGELRPQLLDRFGFCVEMTMPTSIPSRVEALRRRLSFDGFAPHDAEPVISEKSEALDSIMSNLGTARPAKTSMALLDAAARLAVGVGAEGLRADLTLCRAAAALAGVEGRVEANADDLRRVAALVLCHRARRGPFDPAVLDPEDLQQALSEALGGPDESHDQSANTGDEMDDGDQDPRVSTPGSHSTERSLAIGEPRQPPTPTMTTTTAARGRFVRDVPVEDESAISSAPTVRALAARRAHDPSATFGREDLRAEVRVAPMRRTIVLCVDLSGSMGADERAEAATGMVLGLLTDAYQRRDRVALVGFRRHEAQVLLSPTSSIEVARNRLVGLVTGGETPLASGILRGLEVAEATRSEGSDSFLVLLTDGRATGGSAALASAMDAAAAVQRSGISSMVLDCETGPIRLDLAARIAETMGAQHLRSDLLDPLTLAATIRKLSAR